MTLDELNIILRPTDFDVTKNGEWYKLWDHGGLDFGPFLTMRSKNLLEIETFVRHHFSKYFSGL